MSSLSNKQINEISALYGQINLNEATRAQEIVGRVARVASPAIKKQLGVPATQSLSSAIAKGAVKTGSKVAGDVAKGTIGAAKEFYKGARGTIGGFTKYGGRVAGALTPVAALGGAIDYAARGSESVPAQLYKKVKGTQSQSPSGIQQNSVDIFDLIKGHLLDEGYADNEESAHIIMTNMSEEWKKSILEGALDGLS
jgi:hypothetical protein